MLVAELTVGGSLEYVPMTASLDSISLRSKKKAEGAAIVHLCVGKLRTVVHAPLAREQMFNMEVTQSVDWLCLFAPQRNMELGCPFHLSWSHLQKTGKMPQIRTDDSIENAPSPPFG
jgi:hypothetical protein